jgi:hypothetical protein
MKVRATSPFYSVGRIVLWSAVASTLVGFGAAPWFLDAELWGDDLVRFSVRLALFYYGIAAGLMLLSHTDEWTPVTGRIRLARGFWLSAYLAYLIHLAMAMHYYHHWSHADAVEHTREVAGVGEGIYMSHLFTLSWGLDVAYWFRSPASYANRARWIGRTLHAFMIFIVFNGTVVYETGFIRWAGVVLVSVLGFLWIRRLLGASAGSEMKVA